jgi:hypothetical protein
MANVDFTLEDIKELVDTSIGAAIGASEARVMKHMDARFDESNLATVELVGTVLDQIDGLGVKITRIEGELKTTNRLVRKHSLDIMELRAAA